MDLRQQSVFHFHLTATKTGLYFHQKLSSWDSPAACGGAGPGEESQDRLRHFRRLSPNSFGVCHMPGRSKKNQCLRAQSRCSGLRAERSLTYWWLVVGRQVRNSCGSPHARRQAAKTGAGVALEAQLRGLKVACVEQDRNQIREYVLPCCGGVGQHMVQQELARKILLQGLRPNLQSSFGPVPRTQHYVDSRKPVALGMQRKLSSAMSWNSCGLHCVMAERCLPIMLTYLLGACLVPKQPRNGTTVTDGIHCARASNMSSRGSRYLVKGLVKLFSPSSLLSPLAAWNDP